MPDADAPFTYPDVGATRATPFPQGYHQFRERKLIGHGRDLFDRAAAHILSFGIHKGVGFLPRTETRIALQGTEITVRISVGPFGVDAPCRVVYVIDEPNRAGFAYGTLPGHPEIGEELFAVEYEPDSGAVYGVIAAFSRPGAWYVRAAGPIARAAQRLAARWYLSTLPTGS
ncbi:DUF1990 family protein [Nocardia camponoti]|nr:DUF1990 domain-containing protein [Nocardia camponoti]